MVIGAAIFLVFSKVLNFIINNLSLSNWKLQKSLELVNDMNKSMRSVWRFPCQLSTYFTPFTVSLTSVSIVLLQRKTHLLISVIGGFGKIGVENS